MKIFLIVFVLIFVHRRHLCMRTGNASTVPPQKHFWWLVASETCRRIISQAMGSKECTSSHAVALTRQPPKFLLVLPAKVQMSWPRKKNTALLFLTFMNAATTLVDTSGVL
ncbi:uncharacterized protein LOC119185128 isoform X2 [Rhipicephalus microplus]